MMRIWNIQLRTLICGTAGGGGGGPGSQPSFSSACIKAEGKRANKKRDNKFFNLIKLKKKYINYECIRRRPGITFFPLHHLYVSLPQMKHFLLSRALFRKWMQLHDEFTRDSISHYRVNWRSLHSLRIRKGRSHIDPEQCLSTQDVKQDHSV